MSSPDNAQTARLHTFAEQAADTLRRDERDALMAFLNSL